jgi:prevent-host-death family protein
MINIPIAEAHNRLSSLLKKVQKSPILLTRRGKAVGVLIDPEEYEQLRRVKAYLQLLTVSREVGEGASADEIYRASREELEARA